MTSLEDLDLDLGSVPTASYDRPNATPSDLSISGDLPLPPASLLIRTSSIDEAHALQSLLDL
jgi:hypothetical protein